MVPCIIRLMDGRPAANMIRLTCGAIVVLDGVPTAIRDFSVAIRSVISCIIGRACFAANSFAATGLRTPTAAAGLPTGVRWLFYSRRSL